MDKTDQIRPYSCSYGRHDPVISLQYQREYQRNIPVFFRTKPGTGKLEKDMIWMKGNTMDNDKAKLRQYQDDLNVGGLGVVILGAWDVLKVIMYLIMDVKNDISLEEFADNDRAVAVVVIIAMIVVILLMVLLIFKIHLYIGLNASKAAKGEPYKKGYYTGAIILLVFSVLSMFTYIDDLKDLDNIDTTIASFIVDLTMIYVLWIIVSSTRKIRELNLLHTQE